MSTYDDASLILIPSGVKAGKVYSAKPTNGDGDFTFTRASEATRLVDGVVTKVRTNSLLQSNEFDTTWVNTGYTLTSGQTGYDGTNNAWLVECTSAGQALYQALTISGVSTLSFYVKKNSASYVRLRADQVTDALASFNLNTGAVNTTTNVINTKVTSLGNDWYRCSMSWLVDTLSNVQIRAEDVGGSPITGTFYLQNAQVEQGTVATDYIATTTVAVSEGPVANMPRLNSVAGGCPKLLLEPQRTNLNPHSEQFDNAAWTKNDVSVTANTSVSPDGFTSADKVIETATTGSHYTSQTTAVTASVVTASVFLKQSEIRYAVVFISNTIDKNFAVLFDLQLGVIVTNFTSISSYSAPTASSIQNYGNGWYRCSVTATDTFTNASCVVALNKSGVDSGFSYVGDGTSGLFAYGAQLEAASYATSYIPSYGTATTRAADACLKTGISSLIGQTEGTLFVEFFYNEENNIPSGSDKSVCRIKTGGGYADEIAIVYYGDEGGSYGKTIQAFITNGGAEQAILKTPQTMVSGYYKVAVAYKANDFAMAVNGVIVATDNSGSVPTCADFSLNESTRVQSDINPKQALLFPTRLSNTELATLTTL